MSTKAKKSKIAAKKTKVRPKAPPASVDATGARTVEELQTLYEETVGRPSGSTNRQYLLWKISEAKKGRVRIGPPLERVAAGPQMVLALRMDADTVPLVDAAWRKHGMRSRMDLIRRALRRELEALGEDEAAERFAAGE